MIVALTKSLVMSRLKRFVRLTSVRTTILASCDIALRKYISYISDLLHCCSELKDLKQKSMLYIVT